MLAFVLHTDGKVVGKALDGRVYQAGSFAKWLREEASAYEKAHPRTRVPFVRAEVKRVAEATKASKHVLLYFGRDMPEKPTRAQKKEAKAARKFEKGTLDSKKAAKTAETLGEKLVLLRFDLGEEAHAALAKTYKVEKAPRLVLIEAGKEAPELLKLTVSGAALSYRLEKLGE